MLPVIQLESLVVLKAELQTALPAIGACHRVEAMARGLGFNTYASLRAALNKGPVSSQPQDETFRSYLSSLGGDVGERVLSRALARVGVRRAMEMEPHLTTTGYGIAWQYYKTADERRAALKELREELLSDWSADQFELACIYLAKLDRRKTINRDFTSYNLKHQAERLSRDRNEHTHLGNYVCNGILIAAALAAGFQVRPVAWDSLNGFLNASTRSVRRERTGQLVSRQAMTALWSAVRADAA